MEAATIAYLFVAGGSGLIALRFLQSSLKVRSQGGTATMGFMFAGVFSLLALASAFGLSLLLAVILLTLAGVLSLSLARYVLPHRISFPHALFPNVGVGATAAALAVSPEISHLISLLVFLLYVFALLPLLFVFHHFSLLCRNPEVKEQSSALTMLAGLWLGSLSFPLVFTPLFYLQAWINTLAMGFVALFMFALLATPYLHFLFAREQKEALKEAPSASGMVGFLSSF